MTAIPPRLPVTDLFRGAVLSISGACLLARDVPPGVQSVAQGDLRIRYGVQYLGKPHLSIVPELVALDYGEMLTGETAWDFLLHRSNLHPRAEVFGYRNDGTEDMVVVKRLDLAQPIQVLVYTEDEFRQPVARVTALIASQTDDLSPRLVKYLPCYDSLEAWQQHDG